MTFCPKCGHEIDDDDQFCRACGFKISSNGDSDGNSNEDYSLGKSEKKFYSDKSSNDEKKDVKASTDNSENKSNDSDNKLYLIPLVFGIIGVVVGLAEGLGCPLLFGWDNILTEMFIAILGGCIGLYLYKFKEEYFIAGIQFIVTGILMVLLIGRMAIIGCIIFIIAGILAIFLHKKYNANNRILFTLPVFTVVLMFLFLFLMVGVSDYNQAQLTDQVNISNVNNTIQLSYGYYEGDVKGDICFGTDLDYVSMEMEFLDENGKVLDKAYPLIESSVEAGKTYQFDGMYFKEEKPYKAQITLKNDALDDEDPFYMQNITLN